MAFDSLTEKLQNVFKNLRGKGRLTEEDVKLALKEVRLALLEADVNFKVVKNFVKTVEERAVGTDVLPGILNREPAPGIHFPVGMRVAILHGHGVVQHQRVRPLVIVASVIADGAHRHAELFHHLTRDGRFGVLTLIHIARHQNVSRFAVLLNQDNTVPH